MADVTFVVDGQEPTQKLVRFRLAQIDSGVLLEAIDDDEREWSIALITPSGLRRIGFVGLDGVALDDQGRIALLR